MATLSAELDCLHVLDGSIGSLCADDDVHRSSHSEEDRKSPKIYTPVLADRESFLDSPSGKENTHGDQQQTSYEDNWDDDKDENADVRIAGMASNLEWQDEEPGKTGRGYECDAQHANPICGE
jgi:hypothetical protein